MKGIGAVKISDMISLIGHIIEDEETVTICGIPHIGNFDEITWKEAENAMKMNLHKAQIEKMYKPVDVNYITTKYERKKVKS